MADPTGAPEASTPSEVASGITADLEASTTKGTWERIKDHKILQWGLGYLGAAIAIAHGQELMAEAFDWPHLIGRILMSALVVGLPLVLTLSWYHGHKGLKNVGAGELAILSVLTVIAAGLLVVFVRAPDGHLQIHAEQSERQSVAQVAQPPAAAPAGVSLAVLPFVDLSPEHNQDYFSDGLSEELLNQLAQIKELRVAGRTSSFSFKGKNEDLRIIGEKLGVNHLLEGSVRKDGKQLRVIAQLINAVDGTHMWSQTYDRELKGVFAVQEEIAVAVSGALSITLDVGAMSRANGGTTNVDAYDKYLQARKFQRQGGPRDIVQADKLFREVLALDPVFARAWLGMATNLYVMAPLFPDRVAALQKEMDEAGARVFALAPGAWWTQDFRARVLAGQHKWSEAEAAASAAMLTAPVSESYCGIGDLLGRASEDIPCLERARETDRLSFALSSNLQLALDAAGRPAEAQAEYERSKSLDGDHSRMQGYALYRLMARKDADPAVVKAEFRQYVAHEVLPMALNHVLLEKLGNPEAARAAIRQALNDPDNQDRTRLLQIAYFADRFGDGDSALAAIRRLLLEMHSQDITLPWRFWVSGLRAKPAFKDLLRQLGLVDYFRASGKWGDFCKPVGVDDFECN